MTKHTEGEWKKDTLSDDTRIVISAGKFDQRKIIFTTIGDIDEEIKANARLLTSAPEMLKSLKRLVESGACQNNCDKNDMTCDTRFAEYIINKVEGK